MPILFCQIPSHLDRKPHEISKIEISKIAIGKIFWSHRPNRPCPDCLWRQSPCWC
ncbi:hypothetical protein [Moraxella lacunata]|uniref:hypothetical protein n=1 Tax=Moraxella lacunata TaxID=477 RepID=UPI003EE31AA9